MILIETRNKMVKKRKREQTILFFVMNFNFIYFWNTF